MGFSKRKTALRSWLRRPGPASIPQAVVASPSIAHFTPPTVRLVVVRSSKLDSSGASGCSQSADASAILTFSSLGFSPVSTLNSLSAHVPLKDRPGPPAGRLGSVRYSSRSAVTPANLVLALNVTVNLVG